MSGAQITQVAKKYQKHIGSHHLAHYGVKRYQQGIGRNQYDYHGYAN